MLLWRRVAVPAFLGVLGLVWAATHGLAHDIVSQQPAAGHGAHSSPLATYGAYVPTSLALCLTLAAAIATGVAVGRRRLGTKGASIWLFGLVPVLGLAADAFVELPAHGLMSASAAAELLPVLVIGLLVQVPFALVAVGLGSTLVWLAERIARALVAPRAGLPAAAGAFARPHAFAVPAAVLAGAGGSRAPPAAHIS